MKKHSEQRLSQGSSLCLYAPKRTTLHLVDYGAAKLHLTIADGATVFHERVAKQQSFFARVTVRRRGQYQVATTLQHSTHDWGIRLAGTQAAISFRALALASNSQNNLRVKVVHASKQTKSDQLVKHVVGTNGHSKLLATLRVDRSATETEADQFSRCLLLHDTASVFAKPHLQIHTDKVRCTHGATSGQLDKEGLYFLTTRGIPPTKARHLLTIGFAKEITSLFNNEHLQMQTKALLEDTLAV